MPGFAELRSKARDNANDRWTQTGSREEVETKTFNFLLEQAEILRDAGAEFANEAYHAYYDALEMAHGKGMNKECEEIKAELAKL